MQRIHVIAASIDALTPHRQRGRWQWFSRGGVTYAACDPRHDGARAAISADAAVTVLPAASNPSPLPAALAAALAAHGATATDTAHSLLSKLHAAGVSIFDPDI